MPSDPATSIQALVLAEKLCCITQIGWYARLQQSIEAAVKANNGTRAIICGHSLGTLASTYFLNTFTTPAWREDYIAAYVSFSGLYAGAAIAFTRESLPILPLEHSRK